MALPVARGYRTKREKRGLQCSIATAQNWMTTSSRSWWTEKEQRWPVPSRYQERLPFYLFPLKMAATSYRSRLGGGQLLKYCSRSPARGVAGAGRWGAAAVPWEVPRVEGSKVPTAGGVTWAGFCSLGMSREGKVQIVEGGWENCKEPNHVWA